MNRYGVFPWQGTKQERKLVGFSRHIPIREGICRSMAVMVITALLVGIMLFLPVYAQTATGTVGIDFTESSQVTPPNPGGKIPGEKNKGNGIWDVFVPGPEYVTILDPEVPAADGLGDLPKTGSRRFSAAVLVTVGCILLILAYDKPYATNAKKALYRERV